MPAPSWLALLVPLACGSPESAPPTPPPEARAGWDGPARVIAVGDLHGDLDNALAALRLAGVVDEAGRWSGGEAVLVQTGDTTDRGPESKEVVDLVRRLSAEAEAARGRVVSLLGNHEAMNLTGDWRYVHPGDIEGFGGLQERVAALAPDGEYGRWLLARDVAAKVGDTVFVHGGIRDAYARPGLDALNRNARDALLAATKRDGPVAPTGVLGPDGPLWFRGYSGTDADCAELGRALDALDASRMVVGHTTQRDGRIGVRCTGQLLVVDTGISDHYGGNLAALELVGGDARAIYPDERVDLPDP